MTPNGTWIEKGEVGVPTSITTWRKNKLVLTVILAIACILLLALASGAAVYYFYAPVSKKTLPEKNPCDTVLCLFGSQCLLDDTTQRPYCMCREMCTDIFAPVCGDDGVTYSSECELRVSSCTQQRRIVVEKQGSCDIQNPCETMDCRFGSFCSTSFDGQSAQCVCPDKCLHLKNDQVNVCGTDGRTYPNECELQKVSCREMRSIEVKFKGLCDPCDGVECPTSQTCQLDENRKPVCRCNSVCSPDFRPVCGSDGKTYTNECTMRVEACKSHKSIRIIYTGECSSGANPCDTLQCGPFQSCEIDHHGKATCHCNETCEPAVRLVCGSDGRTYHNECEMKKQSCLQKKMIKLLYKGECGERGPCYNHHCSYGAICVVRGGFAMCECPTCAEEFEPVCGTDGISYTNNCKLRREACEQKREIAVSYTGLCTGCENKRCEYYAVCESDGRGSAKCVCPESCIQVESLVCGTDEVTYLNECEMRVAACRKAQYVIVVSKGACDLCQGINCKYGARCEEGKCVCPTECPEADEVVCANDLITYRNECEMRSAACRHDQELNVLFYGECDEVGETQDEGSGLEPDCHERFCRYGGVCEYNAEGIPFCACSFRCPIMFDPVCGSDGHLYDNECKLKEESCKQQKGLMPVHIEMCEEIREVPCDGEIPLLDPSTNRDYYCGDESGGKLCPPGSYCHKSTSFAKCCREVILIKTCSESTFGCCPDGKTAAQGLNDAGCPSVCNCNRLGSYGITCEPTTKQCFCKPGVGGPRCDRCEPGYWGLHRKTEENTEGCTPCACNVYGSVRDDCEQMTGRCVCKQGILGMKCDVCPSGTVLGPDGCMDESIAQPVSGSCEDLFCFHGAVCREKEGDMAQCVCEPSCSQDDPHKSEPVCSSDGNTYSSECQMKLFACRYQKEMSITNYGPCEKGISKNGRNEEPWTVKESEHDEDYLDDFSNSLRRSRQIHMDSTKNYRIVNRQRTPDHLHVPSFRLSNLVSSGRLSVDIEFILYGDNGTIFYCRDEKRMPSVYLSLIVRNKYLELRMRGVKESFILRPPKQLEIGRYHHVSFRRFPHFFSVHLDKKFVDIKSCTEKYGTKFFPTSFTLGNLPYIANNQDHEFSGFHGCISKFRVGKYNLQATTITSKIFSNVTHDILAESSMLNRNTSNNSELQTKLCFPNTDDFSLQVQKRSLTSHLTARADVPENVEVQILFRTIDKTLPLLQWKSRSTQTNRIRFGVNNGRLEMLLACDERKNITIINKIAIDNSMLHNLTIQRSYNDLKLILDGAKKKVFLHKSCSLFHGGSFYILGHNINLYNRSEGSYPRMYRGCIKELHLTNINVKLQNMIPWNFMCKPS